MQDFVYERPETIAEAIAAMRANDARALAGGTDLVPQLREGRRRAARIVDLKHIPQMTAITLLPDGAALQMFPPRLARFWTCTPPISSADSATAG